MTGAGSTSPQRERLLDAMVKIAARYGYGGASVARVVKGAGVSRATFYEHFADREDCFLAAVRGLADSVAPVLDRTGDGQEVEGSPYEILAHLLEGVDRDPAAARAFLIESLAAGSAVRAEHQKLFVAVERWIDGYLDRASNRGRALELPPRALLGGIESVIATRLFRGETGLLIELLDDLGAWLDSYMISSVDSHRLRVDWGGVGAGISSPVEVSPNPLDVRLPRGRAALPQGVVSSEQRQRVFAAVARLAREKGYAEMTVADVIAKAGIARKAFYEQFRGKEDAFLAAQSFALENSISVAASRYFSEDAWPDRVWNAALAMLGYIASVPDLAVMDFVESYAAGPAAIRRSLESRMAYTLFLEEGYRQRPQAERLSRICSEAIAGAILELMRQEAVEGRIGRVGELAPQVVYVAVAPFMGPQAALKLIEEKCGAPIPRFAAPLD